MRSIRLGREPQIAVALAGVAAGVGWLVVVSPLAAGAAIALLMLFVFVAEVPAGVPLLALGGVGATAVVYTQATQGAVPSTAKYATDALLLVGLPLLARVQLTAQQRRAANRMLLWASLSAFAGILGGTTLKLGALATWQDLRWIGAAGVGVGIAGMLSPHQRIAWAFRWLLALNILNLVVSAYQVYAHDYTATRLGLPEVTGLFGQTTLNALVATLLLIFALVERLSISRTGARWAVVIGVLDLVLSTRFKPGLAIVAVMVFVQLRRIGIGPVTLACLGAAIPIVITLALSWASAPGRLQTESEAVTSALKHAEPRVQFMSGAQTLAGDRFPLGSGSGTYGSDLDVERERAAFSEAGLAGVYGFRAQDPQFNSDNFVAHVLGERGYLGLATWLVSLAALIYFTLIASASPYPASVAIAAASLAPVVPIFRDGAAALVLFVPAALCLTFKRS